MASTTMGSKYICKFCMKKFPCGRSLGGHIRSHLIHNNNNSSNSHGDHQPRLSKPKYELRGNPKKSNKATRLINSSPSSCSVESETDPVSIKKDKEIGKRSLSELVEPEQEEVAIAMCLIMLSRDVGKWGDFSSCEFSEDILLLQPKETNKSATKIEKKQGKCSVFGANGIDDTHKKSKSMEFSDFGSLQNGSKLKNNVEVLTNGFASKDQSNKVSDSKTEDVGDASLRNLQCGLKMEVKNEVSRNGLMLNNQCNKPTLSKRKFEDVETHRSGKNWSKIMQFEACEEDELVLNDQMTNTNKRSKFECTTCNKVFHSYQALGGHRASHKRLLSMKNPLVSKIDEFTHGADHLSNPPPSSSHQDHEQRIGDLETKSPSLSSKKVVQKHECPFCFRLFSSGQALGGHKRSHSPINLIERSTSSEIRDVLDLNLPPYTNEEDTTTSSSNSQVELTRPYLWVESSKHEHILSLISN